MSPRSTLGRLTLGRAGLGQAELEAVTPSPDSRWSCGALWGGGFLWEDAAEWPHIFDPAEPLTLGVYVAGFDVTERARSASWQLGQSDVWSPLAVGSASLVMSRDDSDAELAGARVVIATEYDVLWWGAVQTTTEGRAQPTGVEATEAITTLEAVDGFARAQAVDYSDDFEGAPVPIMETLLAQSGVAGGLTFAHAAGALDDYRVIGGLVTEGQALQLLADIAAAYNVALAWAPAGVRAWVRTMIVDATAGTPDDYLGSASSYDRSRSLDDVWNAWAIAPFLGSDDVLTYEDADAERVKFYGRRAHEVVDGSRWLGLKFIGPMDPTEGPDVIIDEIWQPTFDAFAEPIERVSASHLILEAADVMHRALPFDVVSEDDDPAYLLTSIRHTVDTTAWRVATSGLAVTLAEA